jgi:hypothetical protein
MNGYSTKMTTKQNGKQLPFQVGQKIHHLSADRVIRTVAWVSKGVTRSEQVIVTDYDNSPVEADIYVEAA